MTFRQYIKSTAKGLKSRLRKLSFRTGLIILGLCALFYILSFAQMALPISYTLKGVLWVVLFGLAKTAQYLGLIIIGAEGLRRLKRYFSRYTSSTPN